MIDKTIEIRDDDGKVTEVIVFATPDPEPEWKSRDLDGDQLLITTAKFPDGTWGLYFRTSPMGSSITLDQFPAVIEKMQEIYQLQLERTVDGADD